MSNLESISKMETFENIKAENRLLYYYVRGSQCHGIATETSDTDHGGVFVGRTDNLIDLGFNYEGQVSSEKNDDVIYELRKFMQLLIKSNPTILEALFVDDKFVEYESPLFTRIKENRDAFLTKECFSSFYSYADSQIKKAKGLKKLINWDIPQRKGVLDFTYTFLRQGSTNIESWLENNGLSQKYCGLVNIPNMKDIYGVYYDWGMFFKDKGIDADFLENHNCGGNPSQTLREIHKKLSDSPNDEKLKEYYRVAQNRCMVRFIIDFYNLYDDDYELENYNLRGWFEDNSTPIGYRGMVAENSESLRLSSVSKGEKPICYVSYNKDGYVKHCADYKRYKDWEEHRNPIRYESNLEKTYDSKNMCECFRLVKCGIEIANGDGFKVDRSQIDREFLLDIKAHKFEYEELMEKLEKLNAEMKVAMENSTIPNTVDADMVNDMYLDIMHEIVKKG